MRLLIITQKADKDDPILGFFHRWIEEFAKHCESVLVICLEEGAYNLPNNVKVYSLGKERGASKLKQLTTFYYLLFTLRKQYDNVFVHMNQIYVILGGDLWRLWGKRVGLWYTHKQVTIPLRIAVSIVHIIFTASKESFRISSRKVAVMGHGIDTAFFSPDENAPRGSDWLSVGRLMASKRHDVCIQEAHTAGVTLRIAGNGPERSHLESLARDLGASVMFLGALSQSQLRDEYRSVAKLIHRSETGSLDKVVLEAASCGCPVDSSDPAIAILPLSPEYVREHHSIDSLIPRILHNLNKNK